MDVLHCVIPHHFRIATKTTSKRKVFRNLVNGPFEFFDQKRDPPNLIGSIVSRIRDFARGCHDVVPHRHELDNISKKAENGHRIHFDSNSSLGNRCHNCEDLEGPVYEPRSSYAEEVSEMKRD